MDENPYRAPVETDHIPPAAVDAVGRAGSGRFLAAQIDHTVAVVLFLIVGMNSAASIGNVAAGIAALAAYLGYYFIPEWLCGTTIGKSVFSLRVQQISGEPCTAHQAAVRTLMRLLEVNPFLLGALPAGIAILSTQRTQRLGDLLAGTIVVQSQRRIGTNSATTAIRVIRRGN